MSDSQQDQAALSEEQRIALEAEDAAKRQQFGQANGGRIDPGLGHMGGAGASGGIQPDIAQQSAPASNPTGQPGQ